MKQFILLLSLAALAGLGSACTFQSMTQKSGKVVIVASTPRLASDAVAKRGFPTAHERVPLNAPGSLGRSLGRMLSAVDINNLTYTVTNVNDASDTETGSISLYYLSLDLFLTPGETYQIDIKVDIKTSAEGYNRGVRGFGDTAVFTVDPTDDTYVNLTVHPTQTLVLDPASLAVNAPSNSINSFNPAVATPVATKVDILNGSVTKDSADTLFYGPDAKLYYFNKAANAVYRWNSMASPMTSASRVIDGTTDLNASGTVILYAACADPTYQDTVWVVGYDTIDDQWYYYQVDVSGGAPVVSRQSGDLTADLLDGEASATLVPTGIAVDSTYEDVYLSYYNYGGTDVHSGLLQYYEESLYIAYPSSNSPTQSSDDPAQVPAVFDDSIYTDVVWGQGKVWVLKSPNTSLAGLTANTGTADLLIMNENLDPSVYVQPNVQQVFSSGTFTPATATILQLPNRFAGSPQGTKVFVSQQDFATAGTFGLAAIDLDTDSVTTY